jgi:hypothetical protein
VCWSGGDYVKCAKIVERRMIAIDNEVCLVALARSPRQGIFGCGSSRAQDCQRKWLAEIPEFLGAVRAGRKIADAEVAAKMIAAVPCLRAPAWVQWHDIGVNRVEMLVVSRFEV